MSSIAVVAYTTAGGIIGAGLTQYVTHLKDRRSARAQVFEKMSEIEDIFIELRWPITSESLYSLPRMPKLLGSLEAAALIAGLPRTIISLYASGCRFHEDSRRVVHASNLLAGKLAAQITEYSQQLSGHPDSADIKTRIMRISERITAISRTQKKLKPRPSVFTMLRWST